MNGQEVRARISGWVSTAAARLRLPVIKVTSRSKYEIAQTAEVTAKSAASATEIAEALQRGMLLGWEFGNADARGALAKITKAGGIKGLQAKVFTQVKAGPFYFPHETSQYFIFIQDGVDKEIYAKVGGIDITEEYFIPYQGDGPSGETEAILIDAQLVADRQLVRQLRINGTQVVYYEGTDPRGIVVDFNQPIPRNAEFWFFITKPGKRGGEPVRVPAETQLALDNIAEKQEKSGYLLID